MFELIAVVTAIQDFNIWLGGVQEYCASILFSTNVYCLAQLTCVVNRDIPAGPHIALDTHLHNRGGGRGTSRHGRKEKEKNS